MANADGTLTLDEFMPLPEHAILVDSLKDALPNWFWYLHVPDTWELKNKGVDIWHQLTLEHGIVASSTAEKEQILTEWEHFVGLPDESLEAFRARFSRKCSQAAANGAAIDDLRVALKFLLAFAMSRKNNSVKNKLMGKYEKMMVHDLTHWWVNGYDST